MIENDFINIEDFNLSYGNNVLFNNFNLRLARGQRIGIFGPTGTGKTTLLNKLVEQYISKYKISYVFQDNKLLEEQTVLKNVLLPIKKYFSKKVASEKARYFIRILDLGSKLNKKVNILSGGERQRVNIARALVYDCDILIMDEPFSAQDEKHKNEIINIINSLIKEKKITLILVSHDKSDFANLCDSIIKLG